MSVGLGIFWLRERLTRFQSLGAVLALTGVLVISFQPGDYIRLGSLLILLSAFMYALHTAIVKRYGEKMDFLEFFFFGNLGFACDDRNRRCCYQQGFILLCASPYDDEHSFHRFDTQSGGGHIAGLFTIR
jgi:hypothetical protein